MKRLLVTLAFLVIMGGTMAQEKHLPFMGVPIDGTIKQFTNAMINAGFRFEEGSNDDSSYLTGDYAGFKDCGILILALEDCDVVFLVSVFFPEKDTWSSLLSDYEQLKAMLTKEYGKPEMCSERFTVDVGDSDDLKMSALQSKEFEWYTDFSTDLGDIRLVLDKGFTKDKGMTFIMYGDKVNSEKEPCPAKDDH